MQPPVIVLFESPREKPSRVHKRPRIYHDQPPETEKAYDETAQVPSDGGPAPGDFTRSSKPVEIVEEPAPGLRARAPNVILESDECDEFDDDEEEEDDDDDEYDEGDSLFFDIDHTGQPTATVTEERVVPSTKKRKRPRKTQKNMAPSGVRVAMKNGTTPRQRQVILEKMISALADHPTPTPWSENEVRAYCTQLENRVYAGLFGKPLDPSYNYYRSYQYRRVGFELLGALRSDGGHRLVTTYPPDLLAALPGTHLCRGTLVGAEYEAWKTKREDEAQRELAHRQQLKEATGEGWYRCFKCGGKFDVTELQMRGGDEPATIFRTCLRCGFTKRS